jgi:hypothetical protein
VSVRGQYLTTAEVRVLTESDGVTRRHYENNLEASKRGVFLGLLLIILSCVAILVGMLIGNLMPHEAKLADEIERGFEDKWSAVEMAKSDDRIKQIDAEHEFKVTPPQVTDDFDQGSQSQTDTTGSAPIPTSSAAEIDIDQSLAIEFPTAVYEPHKSAGAIKRHPPPRAKDAAKRVRSNNPQANSEAKSKPIELLPNFTNSGY